MIRFLTFSAGRLGEWIVVAIAGNFALTLLNPGNSSFASAPSYQLMAQLATEDAWGRVILFFVLCSLLGHPWHLGRWGWTGIYHLRWVGAAGLFGIYLFLAIMFYGANPIGTGWGTYGLLGLGSGLVALRLAILRDLG